MKYLNLNQKLYLEQIVCFCTRLIEINLRKNNLYMLFKIFPEDCGMFLETYINELAGLRQCRWSLWEGGG